MLTIASQTIRETYTEAMSHLLSGISIVTAATPTGNIGTTITSLASISADPPTIMVSLNRASRTFEYLKENDYFAVSILSASQGAVAEKFADTSLDFSERFRNTEIDATDQNFPLISGALVHIACKTEQIEYIATHAVFFARVKWCESTGARGSLAHFKRKIFNVVQP